MAASDDVSTSFDYPPVIHEYHVYETIWGSRIVEEVVCTQEVDNHHDFNIV